VEEHLTAIAAFTLNLVVLIVGGTWRLSRLDVSLRDAITEARDEIEARQDRLAREYGEAVSAIREKVNQVELYCRDTFVRRDSFYKVSGDITEDMKSLRNEIIDRLERMETKIDTKS
jgi:Sec-independent protein translocase protein TatA